MYRTIPTVPVSSCVPACFWAVLSTQPFLADCILSPITSKIVPVVKSLLILFIHSGFLQKENKNLWRLRKETILLVSAWSVRVTSYCFVILTCLQFVSEFPLWATVFVDKTLTEMISLLRFFSLGLGESFLSLDSFGVWLSWPCAVYLILSVLPSCQNNYNQYNLGYF